MMKQIEIPQWSVFEKILETQKHFENPFTDVSLRVSLWNKQVRHRIDGFYDGTMDGPSGDAIWRFRFAPMFQGRWEYLTSSNEPELDGLRGEFLCTEPIHSGGLTVNHHFPNWFFRADGSPQFILNDGWTPHPGSTYGIEEYGAQIFSYPTEEEYKTFIKRLSSHRVNMTIDLKQLYARQKTCTDPSFLWPWKVVDTETHRIDKERFSLEYFQRLDRQIQFAREHNVFYGVEVLYDNSAFRKQEWANHPYNESNGGWIGDWDAPTDEYTTDQLPFGWGMKGIFNLNDKTHMRYLKRMVSYLVARTSAFWNVFYAMGSESSNIYPGLAELVDKWFDWWGDFVASKDSNGRLLTIGDVAPQSYGLNHKMDPRAAFVYGNARNNMITTQEHTFTDDLYDFSDSIHNAGLCFWKFRRPTIIGEQDGRNNNQYEKERRAFWTAFVSGYTMARIDRHYELADGDLLRESTLFGLTDDPPIYQYMENLYQFVDEGAVSFWRMKPLTSAFIQADRSIYCLGEEDQEYVLYFAKGGSAEISLPEESFQYRWFDPRKGVFTSEGLCKNDGTIFKAPDGEDWALLIQKMLTRTFRI